METGKRIQQLRRKKNMTQEQLAAALGVTSAAVSKWETGASIPDTALLCPLARLLRTTVDGLLDFKPALEQEEIDRLLRDRQKLFEEKKMKEAVESCEALLHEYPDDLRLKCAAAGLYIMYIPAICEAHAMEDPIGRAVTLLEQSAESSDRSLEASARSMLVNLYVMREEYDKALALLDEEPVVHLNIQTSRANIFLRKGELDEAEKLYQTELWTAGRNAVLNLVGLYNTASRRKDWERAMECLDMAQAVEKLLRTETLGGLTGSLHMLRAGIMCRQGRLDEAMTALTEYVNRSLEQWSRLANGEDIRSEFYNNLNMRSSGMSAAYLAKYIRAALEESEELAPLREREDFQALLARLGAAEE